MGPGPGDAGLVSRAHLTLLWLVSCGPSPSGGDESGSDGSDAGNTEAVPTTGATSTGETSDALPEPLDQIPGFKEVFLVQSARAAVVADFDGDGNLDIFHQDILPHAPGDPIQRRGAALLGDGLGGFPGMGPPLVASFPNWDLDIIAGRFTVEDMVPDLLATGSLAIAAGDGLGGFLAPSGPPGFGAGRIAIDFDNDGDDDLIAGSFGHVLFNDGTSYRDGPGFEYFACYHIGFTAIDLDGDPWRDIAVIDSCNAVPDALPIAAYRNLGGTALELVWQASAGSLETHLLRAADLTGDGLEDLIMPDHAGILVFPSRGDGSFDAPETFGTPSKYNPYNLMPIRLDTDAHADLVVTTGFAVLLIDGATRTVQTIPTGRDVFAAGDLNGDGRDDLVVQRVEYPFSLGVWLSQP